MKKLILLVCSILVPLAIAATGCVRTLYHDSSYTPALIGDSTGGAIVLFAKPANGGLTDFVADKIGPQGERRWANGVLLGSGYRSIATFDDLKVLSDTEDGAIVGWRAQPSESGPLMGHVARLNPEGKVLWQESVGPADQLISDGAGGAILAYDQIIADNVPGYSSFALIKIDAEGGHPWRDGVSVSRSDYWPNSLRVVDDGAGGAIAVWEEMSRASDNTTSGGPAKSRVVAQRVDAAGSLPWGSKAMLVGTNPEGAWIDQPALTADGDGGVIVAWQQTPQGRATSGMPEALLLDIVVQKLDAAGRTLWQPDGLALDITRNAENAMPHSPALVSDGEGGTIVMWEDLRNGIASIYAQRMSGDSTQRWQAGGVKVFYVPSSASLAFRQIVADGQGGAVVSAGSVGGVLVQKLDPEGNAVWGTDGVPVTRMSTTAHLTASDGQGGAVVAWGAGASSYVQRVGGDGRLLSWEDKGVRLDRAVKA